MRGVLFALGLLLCVVPASAADLGSLNKTAPGHVDPAPMIPRPPWPPAEAHITDPPQTTTLVVKDTPYHQFGKFDPVLTNACALGRFRPTRSLFRILLTGKTDQANLDAVPVHRRDLLFDPDRYARPDETYYFRNGDLPNCEVRYDGPEAPRKLDARGTTAAPVDRAERKKQALERWGKK